jgi:hypothetical protein
MRSPTSKRIAALAVVVLTGAAPAFAALDRSAPPSSGGSVVQRIVHTVKHWLHIDTLDEQPSVPKP